MTDIARPDRPASSSNVRTVFARLAACIAPCAAGLFVLDTLYRLDSMLKAMAFHDVAVSISTMFLIFLMLGAALAATGTAVALLVWPFRSKLLAAARVLALLGVALLLARAFCHWVLKIGGWETWVLGKWATAVVGVPVLSAMVLTLYYLAVALVVLVCATRAARAPAVLQALEAKGSAFAKALPIVALLPLAVLGFHLAGSAGSNRAPICATEALEPRNEAVAVDTDRTLPDIVLVTFDALTARDMSVYGYRLPTTPNMEQLAGESTVYEHAISASNWTRPGTVSILTGRYPQHHGLSSVLSDAIKLRHPQQTLPDQLRSMGYRTAAVVSNASFAHPLVNGTYRSFDVCAWSAFSPGFIDGNILRRLRQDARNRVGRVLLDHDIYVSGWLDDLLNSFAALRFWQRGVQWNDKPFAPPQRTFELARQTITQAGGKPLFVWVHVFAPHSPYLPSAPYLGHFLPGDDLRTLRSQARAQGLYPREQQAQMDRLRLRYDEYILSADHALGEFVDFLKQSGRWSRTLMVVSADHGESFEDGVYGHRGNFLYEQLVHVPLLVHLPGQRTGQRVDGSASQVDIAPTVLSYLGKVPPQWLDGEPLSSPQRAVPRSAYRYSMQLEDNGIHAPFRKGAIAVSDGRHKLIYSLSHQTAELFDLHTDPSESIDVSAKNPELTVRLRAAAMSALEPSRTTEPGS